MKTADQCRSMGLTVGDTIQGREVCSGGWWSDARLTLLFLGQEVAVFKKQSRNQTHPEWMECGESANWTLEHRKWERVEPTRPAAALTDLQISEVYQRWTRTQGASHADLMRMAIDADRALRPAAAPPARRKPLTDAEISEIYFEALGQQHLQPKDRLMVGRFAHAIEQHHGITGEQP